MRSDTLLSGGKAALEWDRISELPQVQTGSLSIECHVYLSLV